MPSGKVRAGGERAREQAAQAGHDRLGTACARHERRAARRGQVDAQRHEDLGDVVPAELGDGRWINLHQRLSDLIWAGLARPSQSLPKLPRERAQLRIGQRARRPGLVGGPPDDLLMAIERLIEQLSLRRPGPDRDELLQVGVKADVVARRAGNGLQAAVEASRLPDQRIVIRQIKQYRLVESVRRLIFRQAFVELQRGNEEGLRACRQVLQGGVHGRGRLGDAHARRLPR